MDLRTLLALLDRLPPSDYLYPDAAAALEARLPASKRESERRLRDEALARAFGAERPARGIALDAGCGDGEHLRDLAARFEAALGLDADARRVALAHERCPEVPVRAIAIRTGLLPELEGQLRFVQCLQVLGHSTCAAAEEILARLSTWLAPGAPLLLAVPYTNAFADDYRISELGEAASRPVEREEFDEAAASPRPGTLPVRHFAMPSVARLLAQAGLAQEWVSPFGWLSYEHADLLVLARRR